MKILRFYLVELTWNDVIIMYPYNLIFMMQTHEYNLIHTRLYVCIWSCTTINNIHAGTAKTQVNPYDF